MNRYQCEARLLKAMAHPIRLQILQALAAQPACVCDLVMTIERSQPYVSQHLMVLREVGLVEGNREGWNIRYYLVQPELKDLLEAVHLICRPHPEKKPMGASCCVEPIEWCAFNG